MSKVKIALDGYPPVHKGSLPFKYMAYLFPDDLVYRLFPSDEQLSKFMGVTRLQVALMYDFGIIHNKEVTFYYPELFLPPSFQAQWRDKLIQASCPSGEEQAIKTELVRVVTNSPLIIHGLDREQITSIK